MRQKINKKGKRKIWRKEKEKKRGKKIVKSI